MCPACISYSFVLKIRFKRRNYNTTKIEKRRFSVHLHFLVEILVLLGRDILADRFVKAVVNLTGLVDEERLLHDGSQHESHHVQHHRRLDRDQLEKLFEFRAPCSGGHLQTTKEQRETVKQKHSSNERLFFVFQRRRVFSLIAAKYRISGFTV